MPLLVCVVTSELDISASTFGREAFSNGHALLESKIIAFLLTQLTVPVSGSVMRPGFRSRKNSQRTATHYSSLCNSVESGPFSGTGFGVTNFETETWIPI